MGSFDLDLGSVEREIDDAPDRRIVLDVFDGETPTESWLREIEGGNVIVLNLVGDLDELAEEFAGPVKNSGGSLVHFRDFLIVTPADVDVDTDRLN